MILTISFVAFGLLIVGVAIVAYVLVKGIEEGTGQQDDIFMEKENIKEEELLQQSPMPVTVKEEDKEKEGGYIYGKGMTSSLSFGEALVFVTQGEKIMKEDWEDPQFYGKIVDGVLKLHKPDGKFYDWIISLGDLNGDNWKVI